MRKLYVIAGEASGDQHGADLIAALRAEAPGGLDVHGVGGDRIRATGAKDFVDLAHFHVTGISDALKRYPDYKRAERTILANVTAAKPDLAVLIDNPGFNLHLAPRLRALGVPLVYYIAPQVWAWAAGRVKKIERDFEKVLVVFEFEKEFFERAGVPVECVGHPLVDALTDVRPAPREGTGRFVTLLPGSRRGELKMLLSPFLGAAELVHRAAPDTSFGIVQAPTLPREAYAPFLRAAKAPVRLVERDGLAVTASSDLALVCSGTATLECAMLGVPMVISNRGTLLTYAVAKCVVKVPFLGLPNLVLGAARVPELLQFDATPRKLAAAALCLLDDADARARMKADLAEVKRRLGGPGAARRAARAVLATLGK